MPLNIDQLSFGFRKLQLLHVAVRTGLPGALATAPRTITQLAMETALPIERLERLLRGLAWVGVVTKAAAGQFELTQDGQELLDPRTRDAVLFQARFFFRAWGYLDDFFLTGELPFMSAHGQGVFDQLTKDEELSDLFNRPMTDRTSEYSSTVAALDVFIDAASVVDVGGGEGRLLIDLLAAHPAMEGMVFDLPEVREAAHQLLAGAAMGSRARFEGGDMFVEIPAGGDVYVLKWILHDWPDDAANKILCNVARRMNENTRVLILERVVPTDFAASLKLAQADLNMLVLNGGAERSLADYERLLNASGLCLCSNLKIDDYYGFRALTAKLAAE